SPAGYQPGYAAPYSPQPQSPAGPGLTAPYPPVSGGAYGYPPTGPYPPAFGQPQPKSKLPLILGVVIGLLVVGGGVAAFLLLGHKGKTGGETSTSPGVVPTGPSGDVSSPVSTPPTSPTSSGLRTLDQLMPTDLDVNADCHPDTAADPGVVGVVTGFK